MIDYHCHLLPFIDDGPATMEETIHMAYLLEKAGYHTVYCTPHMIKNLYDADNNTVTKLIRDVQNILVNKNISLKLLCGREYILDNYFHEYLNKLQPLENTNYLLVEFQQNTFPGLVKDSISAILRKGFIPMIAHPERYRIFHEKKAEYKIKKKKSILKNWLSSSYSKSTVLSEEYHDDKELLNWLLSNKCAFQNNLLSFKGVYGYSTKITANNFKQNYIYTHEGTDAHTPYCVEKIFGITISNQDNIFSDD